MLTFLSDFGLYEHYVAVVKAKILSVLPQQPIIDISHQVQLGNIVQAAYLLKSIYSELPEGSVHLVAVGSAYNNSHLLIEYKKQYFIGPDNGIFSLCFENEEDVTCYQIGNDLPDSFPVKNIYSDVALSLLKGENIKYPECDDYQRKITREPVCYQAEITGHVVYVEQNGNLITNIDKAFFLEKTEGKKYSIRFEYEKFNELSTGYNDAEYGDCIVFFNSNDLLEIAINHGNASQLLGMKYDSPINIVLND
ncbi:SAM hydrolase/SAM-dependent halogenase family protein [Chondrinema litorale]|uniref:SAM hydrolase/SAM-dependent halogenase family protein n=1 Tax=Chondrinema litorale TaxID=2994555 RepID=UPI002543E82C|nr:SAM-dependent chlorinase/fluorinase [Chondrinema litorale]UZR96039.1 SAM-dependent chlorinase/fluorinase [Chondrinema litorale]